MKRYPKSSVVKSYSDTDRMIAKALLTHHNATEAAKSLGMSPDWVQKKRKLFVSQGVLKDPELPMSTEIGKNFKELGLKFTGHEDGDE